MPEGPNPEIPHSPITTGEKVRQTRKAIAARFPDAEKTLKKTGLHRKLSEKDFNLARISVASNLVREADRDITGIYHKTGFLKRAQIETQVLRRLNQPATIAFIDLNGLKNINDDEGHEAGDEYIQRSVNTLRDSTRAVDIIGRYGGDELIALLIGTDMKRAQVWLEHFKEKLKEANVSASIGFSSLNPEEPDLEGTIKRADEMMYEAKRAYYNEKGTEPRRT